LGGDVDSAMRTLERSAALDPTDPSKWSDLAAAYLEGVRLGRSSTGPQALAAAERALALSPAHSEALFNRALALSYLGRNADARTAWIAVTMTESNPDWLREARNRISDVQSH
jgi:Flp pilus assembly protein TadD